MEHSYPFDLAQVLRERWGQTRSRIARYVAVEPETSDQLPESPLLESIISICYQASLLREEERPARFRLILRQADAIPLTQGPPQGLQKLTFTQPRSLNADELRRLSPAVDFYRSLIGAGIDHHKKMSIWGIVHSGPRWIQIVHGGRGIFEPLPASLVVRVSGPGRIAVCKGLITIAALSRGKIICPEVDVFDSSWMPGSFDSVRAELLSLHDEARQRAKEPWAVLDPDFARIISQNVFRRIISIMRNSHHGGLLIFIPPQYAADVLADNCHMAIKYKFTDAEPRQRFRTIIVRLMNILAESYGRTKGAGSTVGWDEFVTSISQDISALDESIFEVAHLIAGLSGVDGAVVLSKRFELLGFGAEILPALDTVDTVARALDAEGHQAELETTEGVGTRHRAAYRLCNKIHDALAVVVSQDGNVRFVTWKDGMVTYWDQVATSILDV